MSKPKVFIRDATGLTRELSLFDAIILNLCVTAPGFGILLYTFYGPVSFPGINLVLALVVATPFMLAHAFVSGQMMAAMPRSGFDYVFVSRVGHPAIGFANSATFFFFQALFAGVFFTLMNSFISSYFASMGLITGNTGYNSIATMLLDPTWVAIVGTLLLVIIIGVLIGGLKLGKKVLLVTQAIGWIGLIAALAILASNNQSTFSAIWNQYFGNELTYSNAFATAQQQGLAYLPSDASSIVAAAFFTIFTVLGYQSVGYLGGEVKGAQSNIIRAMVISVVFSALVFGVATAIIMNTMSYDFVVSAVFLNLGGKLSVSPYYTLATAILYPNPAVVTLIYLGIFLWLFVTIAAIALLLTRMLFAWAFDGVVPTFFASVSDRFHSPTWSVLSIGILMEVGIFLSLYTQFGVLVNLALVLIATYSINTLASTLLPFLKPEIFKNSPKIVNYKIGGKVPLISVTGAATTAFFWFVIYQLTVNPAIGGAVTPLSAGSIIVVAIAAIVLFYGSRAYKKSRGIDLDFVFREIPPE